MLLDKDIRMLKTRVEVTGDAPWKADCRSGRKKAESGVFIGIETLLDLYFPACVHTFLKKKYIYRIHLGREAK